MIANIQMIGSGDNKLFSTALAPRPLIVGVGGLTSNVGKTTLMCDLMRAFPGWEAIKTTRDIIGRVARIQ